MNIIALSYEADLLDILGIIFFILGIVYFIKNI